ncbi:MAG: L-seryl-tRNA(Sec) selenium transferase [Bacillota bacterium]
MEKKDLLKQIPSVEEVLNLISGELKEQIPHQIIADSIRERLLAIREGLLAKETVLPGDLQLDQVVTDSVGIAKKKWRPNLRRVINATGVVIHTNLGRAVLGEDARKALLEITQGYSNLEMDLETGERGSRYSHLVELLCQLTGAEGALVVNNNAAAVLLALDTLAKGKDVLVSRGELVEIGGSFRIPEVMAASGCNLVEVGTTNKTHLRDYEQAITSQTGLLLKVHPSNYRIMGFSQDVSLNNLVRLGQAKGIPVMEDLGSGFLLDLSPYGITGEPTVQQEVKAGADIVTFSGDKLLGGTQAGIIVGKKELVDLMAKNQLNRALRIDKLTISALEATLRSYLYSPAEAAGKIPVLKMLTVKPETLAKKASGLKEKLELALGDQVAVKTERGSSMVGGGALPTLDLPTTLVTLKPLGGKPEEWVYCLRQGEPAVIVRIKDGKLLLDVRTVSETELDILVSALAVSLPRAEV